MKERIAARSLGVLVALLVLASCQDAPTQTTTAMPVGDAVTYASPPPAGTAPWHSQDIFDIVDETGNTIWQPYADRQFGSGAFHMSFSRPASPGIFEPCRLETQAGAVDFLVCPYAVIQSTPIDDLDFDCLDDLYPLAAVSYTKSCLTLHFSLRQLGDGIRLTATPTAPGNLVFRRWEITLGGVPLPCAEGSGSLTCTFRPPAPYPITVPFFKLVYGPAFQFTGFLSPVDNAPVVNVAKAGSAIPVKFSLGANHGLNILSSGSPSSVGMACGGSALSDDVESTVNAGGSSLSYSASSNQYSYVWKTEKSWAGTCRELRLTLADNSVHTALFKFK